MTQSTENFADLRLPEPILRALSEIGYETPSPIQAACIPIMLEGQDLLGEAQTGTGKTAAFALPTLARVDLAVRAPQVLVLTPTRELAIQVAEAFQSYARHLPGFHVLPLYGGQSIVVQLRQLARSPQIIVGTPGRVLDHIERESLILDDVRTVVLDEADEMLRMGFIDDVDGILDQTPPSRQTALFSATMPEGIRMIARQHMREPREVKIAAAPAKVSAIRQSHWLVRGVDKLDALTRILEVEDDFDAAIVFVRTKIATEELAAKLEARGYEAAALHGDMPQGLRERVIEQLKAGTLDIVVATDVAARGIDVPRISHVINYDMPYDVEAYVHRIGRTGRAGRTGTAILFVAPREVRMLRAIERATGQNMEAISLPTREAVADKRVSQFKQQVLDAVEKEDLAFFREIVHELEFEQDLSSTDIAAALAWLFQRERPLRLNGEDIVEAAQAASQGSGKKQARNKEGRDEGQSRKRNFPAGDLQRYRIEVGRNQGASPKEIVGAIANEGGIEGRHIGQIHIFADHSTVELPANLPRDVMELLQHTRVRQCPLHIRTFQEGDLPSEGGARKGKNKRGLKGGGNAQQQNRPRPPKPQGQPQGQAQGRKRGPKPPMMQEGGEAASPAPSASAPVQSAPVEAPAPAQGPEPTPAGADDKPKARKSSGPRTPRPRKKPAAPPVEAS